MINRGLPLLIRVAGSSGKINLPLSQPTLSLPFPSAGDLKVPRRPEEGLSDIAEGSKEDFFLIVKVNVNNLNVRTLPRLLSWKVGHAVRAMSAGSLPSGADAR